MHIAINNGLVFTSDLVHGQVWEVCSLAGVGQPSRHVCFPCRASHLS